MKKITTLFRKDPNDLSRVINEVDPQNEWALNDDGVRATRKFDGSACAIIEGCLYKRYDVKKGRKVPPHSIPCQDPDPITGHWPHWVKCDLFNNGDQFFFEGLNNMFPEDRKDGTYELVGPKVQGNPEKYACHILVRHGSVPTIGILNGSYEGIKAYLYFNDIEGIVFHHPDGRMCKIRKSDFGFKRNS